MGNQRVMIDGAVVLRAGYPIMYLIINTCPNLAMFPFSESSFGYFALFVFQYLCDPSLCIAV